MTENWRPRRTETLMQRDRLKNKEGEKDRRDKMTETGRISVLEGRERGKKREE